jgi:serine/threonine protein phosphatase PrpC
MPDRETEYAWRTDTGKVRAHNEDAVSVFPGDRLVIVADGIGGASAGEVASRLATDVIAERFRNRPSITADRTQTQRLAEEAVAEANRVIWDSAQRSPRYSGMGTTVVVGYAREDWLVYAHVGDSRLYRLSDSALVQLTRDHSLIQEVVDQGIFSSIEDAVRSGINENIITRGLGTASQVDVDSGAVDMCPGDLFLFCTDGLTGMVTDDDLTRAMLDTAHQNLDSLAEQLVELANKAGGLDNITLALMRVS